MTCREKAIKEAPVWGAWGADGAFDATITNMKLLLVTTVLLSTPCVAQELPPLNANVQTQIQKTFDTMNRRGVGFDSVEVFREAQKVKGLAGSEDAAVRQLAIYVATTESVEDTHALAALVLWRHLNLSPKSTIRVLAPYLDSDNRALRGFVDDLFDGQNFEDFRDYVRRQEDVPVSLVDYLYERSPGEALLVMSNAGVDVKAQLQAVRTRMEANRQDRELTSEERDRIDEVQEQSERRAMERREILLAEHVVANAIWLKQNKFYLRFGMALPEAKEQLTKLSKNEKWWARRYVVEIMRRYPELRVDTVWDDLSDDDNELVRKAFGRRR